jgi:hypothetical protein
MITHSHEIEDVQNHGTLLHGNGFSNTSVGKWNRPAKKQHARTKALNANTALVVMVAAAGIFMAALFPAILLLQ